MFSGIWLSSTFYSRVCGHDTRWVFLWVNMARAGRGRERGSCRRSSVCYLVSESCLCQRE